MKGFIIGFASFSLLITSSVSFAQNSKNTRTAEISGKIVESNSGEDMNFATVVLEPSGMYATSDEKGNFSIKGVAPGVVRIKVQFFGMNDIDTSIVAKAGAKLYFKFKMQETNFLMKDVVVTAKVNQAGKSTSSQISRQAMDHLQTSSLRDIMSLLPGVRLNNPNLNRAQTLSIRNNTGYEAGSLGTAVIVDGAPVSNNANMQFLSSSVSGNTHSEVNSSSAMGGADIRALSTDNIESVEVIRGIPSVEYGDLTGGAVLVRSKAGHSPLTIRFKTNPNIYQVSAAKGISISPKLGELNFSGDYAYNRHSLTTDYRSYQRASFKTLWTVRIGRSKKITETSSLNLTYARDRARPTVDIQEGNAESFENGIGAQFNTNGRASVNGDWLKSIKWLLSASYTDKHSFIKDGASNALNLYSTAMGNSVYTNIPGLSIKDAVTGEEITRGEKNVSGRILPYSYRYEYDIYGKEVNVFAKLNMDLAHTWGNFTERLLVGGDFKTDGNLGKGAVYQDETPPFRNIGNASSGYRRRNFYDIPFVNQLGLYAENYAHYKLGERNFNLSAGVRYDWVNGLTCITPRINASADLFPFLTLRGGWGIASKAPTSVMLNPQDAYHDAINFNGMNNGIPENERLLVSTTSVHSAVNKNLKIATNRKAELGFDLRIAGRYRLSVTAYDEFMDNGYIYGRTLESFVRYTHRTYKKYADNPGAVPSITKAETYHPFFEVYRPTNNLCSHNSGVEYELDFGRFDAIRTSFYINGAWTFGESYINYYSFSTRTRSGHIENNIGVFSPAKTKDYSQRALTTFRATHNIPQIGMALTLSAQINWFLKSWSEYFDDDKFIGYLSYKDGKFHKFNSPKAKADIIGTELEKELSYLYPSLSDLRFIVEKTQPYVLMNLNLSKEIGDTMTASFYVNNMFNSHPLYRSKSSGTLSDLARGVPIFFGFEMKINIR